MHGACDLCEERVVDADADVLACHDSRTALAHDNFADSHFLAIRAFNAEVLRVRIGQVVGCSACFYMGHKTS